MARPGARLLGPLGWRLFAAFTLVGVGAVALLAGLAVASVRSQTSGLVASQREQARHDIAAALAGAYARAGSWQKANLAGAQALAESTGARLVILDAAGSQVATVTPSHEPGHEPSHEPGHGTGGDHGGTPTPGEQHGQPIPTPSQTHHDSDSLGPQPDGTTVTTADHVTFAAAATRAGTRTGFAGPGYAEATSTLTRSAAPRDQVPVVVGGTTVGTVVIDFPAASQTAAWQARAAILQAVGAGAVAAVALAAMVALVVSRRTTRPLAALTAAAGALERGNPDAAALLRPGPGELGQVSAAFARMAGTLKREDELRRSMVADIAHELRTPVTILQGATEELLDGIAAPTTGKLTSLHDEVLRLGRLVGDLSTLAAAQAATLTLQRARTDLGEVAAQAAEALAPQVKDAELGLELEARPVIVDGDPERLTQIVTNLLTNAIKFTPAGGRITLATRAEGATARLTVADTGPGIPEPDLPHLFERFWRAATATGHAGAGIGLAVAAELAVAHGGTITAASPPGGGATFTLTLPAAP